jgi:SAM-dependent methyltransferase
MYFIKIIKSLFKKSSVYNFNNIKRNEWIKKQAGSLSENSRVLDAGAGSCPYRSLFSHCDYKTQDFINLEDEQLSYGKYGNIDYVCDISNIPVGDSSFDAVLCSEVLEHVPDPVSVIKEFARILKPGGKLILTAPLGSGLHQEPFHFYGGYTEFWYDKYLSEAGYGEIIVEANGGSLQACGQESMRFIQLSRPFKMKMPLLVELLWLPVWLVMTPLMFLLVPYISYLLNKYDKNKNFTIGYHVTAKRLGGNISK